MADERDDIIRSWLAPRTSRELSEPAAEPPVVARMVIEIRSDGRRTIARGALEDQSLGERIAVRAEGTTPLALALSLARSIFQAPVLMRAAAKALLGEPHRGK